MDCAAGAEQSLSSLAQWRESGIRLSRRASKAFIHGDSRTPQHIPLHDVAAQSFVVRVVPLPSHHQHHTPVRRVHKPRSQRSMLQPLNPVRVRKFHNWPGWNGARQHRLRRRAYWHCDVRRPRLGLHAGVGGTRQRGAPGKQRQTPLFVSGFVSWRRCDSVVCKGICASAFAHNHGGVCCRRWIRCLDCIDRRTGCCARST